MSKNAWRYKQHSKRNRHHLVPKDKARRRGEKPDNSINNLLLIDIERHVHWHKLFKTMDIDEVIALLQRVKRAKENQKGE